MTPYKSYAEYLATTEFRSVCGEVADRSRGRCEHCQNQASHFHHVRYCRWGDVDVPENLLHLCHDCHANCHRCSTCKRVKLKARHIKAGACICDECSGIEKIQLTFTFESA